MPPGRRPRRGTLPQSRRSAVRRGLEEPTKRPTEQAQANGVPPAEKGVGLRPPPRSAECRERKEDAGQNQQHQMRPDMGLRRGLEHQWMWHRFTSLDAAKKEQDEQDDQDYANRPAPARAPLRTVRPRRKPPGEQEHKEHDENDVHLGPPPPLHSVHPPVVLV